jgi:hypothetical protein
MKAIGTIDINIPWLAKHDAVAWRFTSEAMRGLVIRRIGFCLDDDAANIVDGEGRTNKISRDISSVSGKKLLV